MKIYPLNPLILPTILLGLFIVGAAFIPSYAPLDSYVSGLVNLIPESLSNAAALITRLGDPIPLIAVALVVAGWELYRKNYIRSLVMAGSLSVLPIFFLLKETIQRARPVTDYIVTHDIHGYSFPSGHSSGSMAIYGMVFVLAYSHLTGTWRLVVTALCAIIIFMIGLTRIYLGAHFPTDVLAGWLVGLLIISLLRSLSLYLATRSDKPNVTAIEDTTEDPSNH